MTSAVEPGAASPVRLLALSMLMVWAIFPPETRGESLAAAGVLAVLVLAATRRLRAPVHGEILLAAAVLLVWPVSILASAPGAVVEPVMVWFLAGWLGLRFAAHGPEIRRGDAVAWALAGVGVLVSLMAVHQITWGLEATAASVESMSVPEKDLVLARLRSGRGFAAFATPATLGGFLGLALPVTIGLARDRRGRARVFTAVAAAVQVVGLVATFSATAVTALLAAVVLLIARRPAARRPLAAAVVVVVALLAAVIVLRRDEVLDRSRWDSPWRLRAGNYRIAVEMIRDHPWTGVGPGGYGESFPGYRREGDNETRHAHDLPLEMMAELGLLPGAAAGALFAVVFLGPAMRREPFERAWHRGAAVGLAAFAFHNLVDFTAYFPSMLWSAAVLRAALARGRGEAAPRYGTPVAALVLVGAMASAGVAVGAGLSWNARHEARSAAALGQAESAARRTRRAARLAPWSIDAQSLRSQALLARDETPDDRRLRRALRHAERAVRLSPVRPSARELRGRIRSMLGDTPGAYADLVEAERLYPLHDRYRELRATLEANLPSRESPE